MKKSLKKTILDLVRDRRGSVSFADLALNVPGFTSDDPASGFELGYPHGKNIVIWQGMSKAGADAIGDLLRDYEIILRPVGAMIYAIDGLLPAMQVAKKSRAYQRPHWLPMVIDLSA